MKVIRNKWIFLVLSGTLIVLSIVSLSTKGLSLGVDFAGGAVIEVEYKDTRPDIVMVRDSVENGGFSARVQPIGENGLIVRTRDITESEHQEILRILKEGDSTAQETRFNSIGPSIGKELRTKAVWAIALVVLAIILFIAFVFRHVSKPVSSWKYGLVAIVALFHDIIIPAGIFSFLGKEIDALFIVGLLSILGLSVNDTIVVFDRIRENLHENDREGLHQGFDETVGKSINQTYTRSINTSLTTIFVLTVLLIIGPVSTQDLALVLLLGISLGTYSSIFVASPLLVLWNRKKEK
jgi:preprotein translocase subunit SecF